MPAHTRVNVRRNNMTSVQAKISKRAQFDLRPLQTGDEVTLFDGTTAEVSKRVGTDYQLRGHDAVYPRGALIHADDPH